MICYNIIECAVLWTGRCVVSSFELHCGVGCLKLLWGNVEAVESEYEALFAAKFAQFRSCVITYNLAHLLFLDWAMGILSIWPDGGCRMQTVQNIYEGVCFFLSFISFCLKFSFFLCCILRVWVSSVTKRVDCSFVSVLKSLKMHIWVFVFPNVNFFVFDLGFYVDK